MQRDAYPDSEPAQNRFKENLRRHWGFVLLCAFSLLSLVRLLRQTMPGHYRIFTGAARMLWHGQNPYGTDFGTGVGYYFYSPTCALTLFGPFSLLPEKLGLTVYMVASWLVFVWGVRRFWRSYSGDLRLLQWFWAIITAQMVGAILASKLEIAMTGILLGTLAWLKESTSRRLPAAILLAAILNWKFQPLPVVGLFVLSSLLIRRDWKLPMMLGAALGAWYLLPFAFFSREFVMQIHETWQTTFSKFVAESVLNFENIFSFLHNAFGIPLSFAQTQIVSAIVGPLIAIYLIAWIRRAPPAARMNGATLISVGMGTMFMTVFSPLGQNNAYILYAPLLLCALICTQGSTRRWTALIAISCAVMILAYSDLVPHDLREILRHYSIKPLACLALGAIVKWELWFRPSVAAPSTP